MTITLSSPSTGTALVVAMQRIQFADAEVARLNAQVAMFQIARNTYFQQLKDAVA